MAMTSFLEADSEERRGTNRGLIRPAARSYGLSLSSMPGGQRNDLPPASIRTLGTRLVFSFLILTVASPWLL